MPAYLKSSYSKTVGAAVEESCNQPHGLDEKLKKVTKEPKKESRVRNKTWDLVVTGWKCSPAHLLLNAASRLFTPITEKWYIFGQTIYEEGRQRGQGIYEGKWLRRDSLLPLCRAVPRCIFIHSNDMCALMCDPIPCNLLVVLFDDRPDDSIGWRLKAAYPLSTTTIWKVYPLGENGMGLRINAPKHGLGWDEWLKGGKMNLITGDEIAYNKWKKEHLAGLSMRTVPIRAGIYRHNVVVYDNGYGHLVELQNRRMPYQSEDQQYTVMPLVEDPTIAGVYQRWIDTKEGRQTEKSRRRAYKMVWVGSQLHDGAAGIHRRIRIEPPP